MFRKKYFISSFIVIFILIAGMIVKVSAREKYNYYIHINSKGSFYNLYINGLEVENRSSVKHETISLPVNTSLVTGVNKLKASYMPLTEKLGRNSYKIGPKEDFYISVELERINLSTRDKVKISLLDIKFDMEKGNIISSVDDFNGKKRIFDGGDIKSTFEITNGEDFFYSSFSKPMPAFSSYSLFQVTDVFPDFVWKNGKNIEIKSSLIKNLRAAYKDIYTDIEKNDFNSVYSKLEPVWSHGSESLHLGTAKDFVEKNDVDKKYIKKTIDGTVLGPLRLSNNLDGDIIQVLGDGKLVRILPAPIKWYYEGTKKGKVAEIVFYMDKNGQLKPGAIM